MTEVTAAPATDTSAAPAATTAPATDTALQIGDASQASSVSQPAADAKAPDAQASTVLGGTKSEDGSQQVEADKAAQPAADADNPDEPAQQGAPESYEFKAPEGYQLDDAAISNFSEIAKELNLTAESAQTLVEKMIPVIAQRQATQQAEAFKEVTASWLEAAKADKEIGGKQFDESVKVANIAMDKFGTPDLRALMDKSGLGNNPEVVRLFYRIGKAISEDSMVAGGPSVKSGKSMADRLYTS